MNMEETVRILVFQNEDGFVAQCLEYDICTQAPSMEILRDRMDCLICAELEEASGSGQSIDPAPEEFHNMWDGVDPVDNGPHQYGFFRDAA